MKPGTGIMAALSPSEVPLLPADAEARIRIPDSDMVINVVGQHDAHIRLLEAAYTDTRIIGRGDELVVSGPPESVAKAQKAVDELILLLLDGQQIDEDRVQRVIDMVNSNVPSPSDVLIGGIPVARGRLIRPKTLGQRAYMNAINENTVVFGIGPAGTGKTYLGMAAAVEAL